MSHQYRELLILLPSKSAPPPHEPQAKENPNLRSPQLPCHASGLYYHFVICVCFLGSWNKTPKAWKQLVLHYRFSTHLPGRYQLTGKLLTGNHDYRVRPKDEAPVRQRKALCLAGNPCALTHPVALCTCWEDMLQIHLQQHKAWDSAKCHRYKVDKTETFTVVLLTPTGNRDCLVG